MSLNIFDTIITRVVEVARAKDYNLFVVKFIIGGIMKKVLTIAMLGIVATMGGNNFSASMLEIKDVETDKNNEYILWTGDKGQSLLEDDIIYTSSGEKYIVESSFESKGGDEQLNSSLVTTLVEVGDEVIVPAEGKQARMETCIGGTWKNKATGVSKTGITNSYFGTKKRKTSAYNFSGTSQRSISTTVSGYGVTIKYDNGVSSGGSWEVLANPQKFSRVKTNVKGNVQQKQLSNCSTSTRFVETHEWATVTHYDS